MIGGQLRVSVADVRWTAFLCCSVVLLFAPPAVAQESHWGVTGSFVPKWQAVPELWKLLYDVKEADASGSEFRIGVVRGSDRGGVHAQDRWLYVAGAGQGSPR